MRNALDLRRLLFIASALPLGYIVLGSVLLNMTEIPPWFVALEEANLLFFRVISFNVAALVITGMCFYLVFFYRREGLLLSRIEKHLTGQSVFWPVNAPKKYILNIWQVNLGLLQIIALVGFVLSLMYRSNIFVIIWVIFSILCYGVLHSKLPQLESILVDLQERTQALAETTQSKIIYADGELILKEEVFIRRLSTYRLLSEYADLETYGFLPNNIIYFKFNNEVPFTINSRDAKTVIKLLKKQLDKNDVKSQVASSKTIRAFLDQLDKTNYYVASLLVVLILSSLALFFFWTGIHLGLPNLIVIQ